MKNEGLAVLLVSCMLATTACISEASPTPAPDTARGPAWWQRGALVEPVVTRYGVVDDAGRIVFARTGATTFDAIRAGDGELLWRGSGTLLSSQGDGVLVAGNLPGDRLEIRTLDSQTGQVRAISDSVAVPREQRKLAAIGVAGNAFVVQWSTTSEVGALWIEVAASSRRAYSERLGHPAWAGLSRALAVTAPLGVELEPPARVWRDGDAVVAFEIVDGSVVLHRWFDVELHTIIGPHPQDATLPEVTDPHHVVLFSSSNDQDGLPEAAWAIVDVATGVRVGELPIRLGGTPPLVSGDVMVSTIGDYHGEEAWQLVGYDLRSRRERWTRVVEVSPLFRRAPQR
jgi:hypothetical protein